MLLLAVGVAGGGAALAVASVPDGNGVISACVSVSVTGTTTVPATTGGNVRIIDPASQTCHTTSTVGAGPASETELTWNQTGPTGPQGPPGNTGAQGAPGKSVTVAGGHTLTIGGGQVITVGALPSNTLTITTPPSKPSGSTVTLAIGGTTIPILGFSFVNQTARTGGGSGAGRAALHEFQITKQVDKSSPKLALACANGTHFKQVTITLRKAGGTKQQYLRYTLTNTLISSFQTGGSGHNVTPTESLSLNFTKIQITYSK